MTTVSPKKARVIWAASAPPPATISCTQVSTWNNVSHKNDGQMAAGRSERRFSSSSSRSATVWGKNSSGTPPSVMVSPSRTGAEPSTGLPLICVPPLDPRS